MQDNYSDNGSFKDQLMEKQLRAKSNDSLMFDKILKDKEEENLRLHQELDLIKRQVQSEKREREHSLSPDFKNAKMQQLELKF